MCQLCDAKLPLAALLLLSEAEQQLSKREAELVMRRWRSACPIIITIITHAHYPGPHQNDA